MREYRIIVIIWMCCYGVISLPIYYPIMLVQPSIIHMVIQIYINFFRTVPLHGKYLCAQRTDNPTLSREIDNMV